MSRSARLICEQFAAALDTEDYATAADCLSPDCRYASPDGELIGPESIIASYRSNGEQAQHRFDRVIYSHAITERDDGQFSITFSDELHRGGRMLLFQCRQLVEVSSGRIAQIVHEEIPGQRRALDAFLAER